MLDIYGVIEKKSNIDDNFGAINGTLLPAINRNGEFFGVMTDVQGHGTGSAATIISKGISAGCYGERKAGCKIPGGVRSTAHASHAHGCCSARAAGACREADADPARAGEQGLSKAAGACREAGADAAREAPEGHSKH